MTPDILSAPTTPVAPVRAPAAAARSRDTVAIRRGYDLVRGDTETLCDPLVTEDFVVSSMPDVSPTKWHLAHTSWFFETFVLLPHLPSYRPLNEQYAFLFNSYYVQAGARHCRAQRGLVTRPTVNDVFAYREWVDGAMHQLMRRIDADPAHEAWSLIEIGIHHEQQHQELLLTDIKHVFFTNPMRPAYRAEPLHPAGATPQGWQRIDEGVHEIGHSGEGFHFDNEAPRHRTYLAPASIAHRLVTNAEYAEFIADGGYTHAPLWLSAGFAAAQEGRWSAPLYWEVVGDAWHEFTLAGMQPLDPNAPVTHVSHHEADAFARWAGMRLPTEPEWEVAASAHPLTGRFVEARSFHPSAEARTSAQQFFGDAWQWTQSAYLAYPGFTPAAGAIGEYNGKFMSDQWILRGASCATPASHARHTYRNFFPSDARWQFTGIRLARDTR
ncbi:MAG: ergothioneine biosynthesis protein EgtB [Gemmatimonadota bacterium]